MKKNEELELTAPDGDGDDVGDQVECIIHLSLVLVLVLVLDLDSSCSCSSLLSLMRRLLQPV